MSTPEEEFNTIINKFNEALSHMGPGIGDPVTRAERALLKTFYLFMLQDDKECTNPPSAQELATQNGE